MSAKHTPGPWSICQHLKSVEDDAACRCGYRGVVFGPEHGVAMAICQPGHDPAPEGQEGTEPGRYDRAIEIANARLIAAAPELLEALEQVARPYGMLDIAVSEHMNGARGDDMIAVAKLIRAAIAKARGDAA